MTIFGLTIAETLGLTSFAYILAVAAFNAGYFSNVPSRFTELFSFSDVVNSNIPILQYIIGLYFTYILLAIVFAVPKIFLDRGMTKLLSKPGLPTWIFSAIDVGAFIVVGASCLWLTHILDQEKNKFFSIEFIPWAIFYTMIFQEFWTKYRLNQILLRTFLIQVALNAGVFCYTTGKMWLKYEIRSPSDVQAMYTKTGCIDRKLLRASSNGYLLYSFDLKQFEFRDKSEIKTIYSEKGCT